MLSSLPRYAVVITQLRQAIQAGELAERLPAEIELAERYGVSRMTLRRALSALIEEGLIESRHGDGTFIRAGATSSRAIALLVAPDLIGHHDNLYLQQVVTSLMYSCSERGWLLRVAPNVEELQVRLSAGRGAAISACIAIAFGNNDHHLLRDIQLPIVGIDGDHLAGSWSILPDNAAGTATAIVRLAGLGHRRIAHICGAEDKLAGRERKAAFLTAMADAGLALADGFVVPGSFMMRDGYHAMCRLWSMDNRPTAIYCASDMIAIGAARWAAENGVKIGRDVSLIGCDGLAISALFWPSISTLAIDFRSHAQAALDVISETGQPGIRRTSMRLVERDSLGQPS